MGKINIAELLKDCPKGAKLYTPLLGECELKGIIQSEIFVEQGQRVVSFNKYGNYWDVKDSECILFPSKDNRDWSTFQRPFKDGDILVTNLGSIFILKTPDINNFCYGCYVALNDVHSLVINNPRFCVKSEIRFATEEEKQKLFDAIKANGYKWNAETKTLDKLIEPTFKVGDRVKEKKAPHISGIITDISDDTYRIEYKSGGLSFFSIKFQDGLELVPNKFDITALKAFESRVLVRDNGYSLWQPSVWGLYDKKHRFPYITIGNRYKQCIPFEGNEHLLGTTNNCNEYYKTW